MSKKLAKITVIFSLFLIVSLSALMMIFDNDKKEDILVQDSSKMSGNIVTSEFNASIDESIILPGEDFFMHEGIVKCLGVKPGNSFEIDGVEYLTVDDKLVRSAIISEKRICTSHVTDMRGELGEAFVPDYYSSKISISDWDTSKVIDMNSMFYKAANFNQDISKWNTSNVLNMWGMFMGAFEFNQDISAWDVSKVKNMGNMFNSASSFNQPIGNWDTGSVTDMSYMFFGALSFSQPIGNWDVSKTTDMNGMFGGAKKFSKDIKNWNVKNVNLCSNIFFDCPLIQNYKPLFNCNPN